MEDKDKINYCKFCNTEQGLVGETDFYCERCGAKNYTDGSCEVPDQEESERQQDFYDNNEGCLVQQPNPVAMPKQPNSRAKEYRDQVKRDLLRVDNDEKLANTFARAIEKSNHSTIEDVKELWKKCKQGYFTRAHLKGFEEALENLKL